MKIELLSNLSLASYIVAGVFFVVATVLFFTMHIPRIVGELSGRTAKKAIAEIRKQNEAAINNMPMSNAAAAPVQDASYSTPTAPMQPANAPVQGMEPTAVLSSAQMPGSVAHRSVSQPVRQPAYSEQTAVLDNTTPGAPPASVPTNADSSVTVEVEMTFTGSTELVE